MKYELLISEKPNQALKIAQALADDKVKKHKNNKVPFYEITHKGKKIMIGCGVGHLFTLREKDKGKHKWSYPVFEFEWVPAYEVGKRSDYTKEYIETLTNLTKEANKFTVCTDFDEEGSLIGQKIVEYICKKKDARRMKFSSLTKQELIDSYEHASKTLDWPQIRAGETRHGLDWLWGINSTRALTLAVKAARSFKILSTGRVQGPALYILAEREKEISKFKAKPYWEIFLSKKIKNKEIDAEHKKGKFWDKKEAAKILKKTKGKDASIESIKKTEFRQEPPNPFDLTSLQLEAYRMLGISPKETMQLTQGLYIKGLITYPRTSSQEIPESIGYRKLISKIAKQDKYRELANLLLKEKTLRPNNGKKKDPAHPAVIVTGEVPKTFKDREARIYDLILKRTLATFGQAALRESMDMHIDCNGEKFVARGSRTLEENWHIFYKPYVKLQEKELPKLKEEEVIKKPEITQEEKETKPPKRYTPASIIKELEKRNLGTKATRSAIVDTLYDRSYLDDKQIKVTQLGMIVVKTLKEHVPDLLSEELTREFEKELDLVLKGKKSEEQIINMAKKILKKLLKDFKDNELKIGKALIKAIRVTRDKETIVGKCEKCGGDLRIIYTRRFNSYFIACNKYPKCRNTHSLPKYAKPRPTGKICGSCKYPLVMMIRARKRPYDFCINKDCPKKEEWAKEQEKKIKESKKELKVMVKKTKS